MRHAVSFLMLGSTLLWGIDSPSLQVPVVITHEKGSFSGQLTVSLNGSLNKARVEWSGAIRNTSAHRIFRATFCVKAFDSSSQQIKPGGSECVLTLWASNWDPGVSLNFKGKQDIKIAEGKAPVQVGKYTIELTEIFDRSPNIRQLDVACRLVWLSGVKVFADRKFRPTVMDQQSFTATFAYDGGRVDGQRQATQMLKSFTQANTGLMGPTWESFRIDAASLYLREDKMGTCAAEIRLSFAGFGKPFMGTLGWYVVESNFTFEKSLLDELEREATLARNSDLDRAIEQLPTEAAKSTGTQNRPKLTITSEPGGAEIEINGEFVGNTPTTLTTKEGKVVVRLKKAGFQLWERVLTLNSGDERTLSAELTKSSAAPRDPQ